MTYKYFKVEDFACSETGENEIQDGFVKKLDELREACGFPFIVTSGYRSPDHPIEAKKLIAERTFFFREGEHFFSK